MNPRFKSILTTVIRTLFNFCKKCQPRTLIGSSFMVYLNFNLYSLPLLVIWIQFRFNCLLVNMNNALFHENYRTMDTSIQCNEVDIFQICSHKNLGLITKVTTLNWCICHRDGDGSQRDIRHNVNFASMPRYIKYIGRNSR